MLFKKPIPKNFIIEIISLLFILLFVYASISKLLEFNDFQTQLGQSPLLAAFAVPVSYGVIGIELATAGLLAWEKTRKLGLYTAYLLMVLFTTYIVIILNFTPFTPCSCGGVLESLGWTEHLVFNVGFILLAILGVITYKHRDTSSKNRRVKNKIVIWNLVFTSILGVMLVITLYALSEKQIHRNNAFIRRYLPHPVTTIKGIEIPFNSYYLAGVSGDQIYLGNTSAPAHILSIDTTLNYTQSHQIELYNEQQIPFFAPQIKIKGAYFYILDGQGPTIFKGLLADWKAYLFWQGKPTETFSRTEIASPSLFIFSGLDKSYGQNVLGRINFNDMDTVVKSNQLLKKQIDGVFDTDGMLRFNSELNRLLYVYYYRNEFIIADTSLNLDYKGRTIDTVKNASLKITTTKSGQIRTLGNQSTIINKQCATWGDYLFVKSDRLGKYEPKEMLKDASIIDVYNLNTESYDFSFYLYHFKGEPIKTFTIYQNRLIGLSENYLVTFRLNPQFFNLNT